MNTQRRIPFVPLLALLLAAALAAGTWLALRPPPPPPAPLAGSGIGGPFALVDQDGRAVTDRDFAGRWRLMYFGYSFCPDICPTDLQRMGQALRLFETMAPDRAARIAPIFITIDPERDTPAILKPYVAAFHPRLVGLTGNAAAITAATKAFRVVAEKRATPGAATYLMDHSALTYLMAPDGAPVAFATSDQSAEALAALLDRYVD